MCLAVSGKIKKVEGKKVLLDYPGEERWALVGDEQVLVGDYVMVQMGIIIRILSPNEAKLVLAAWSQQ